MINYVKRIRPSSKSSWKIMKLFGLKVVQFKAKKLSKISYMLGELIPQSYLKTTRSRQKINSEWYDRCDFFNDWIATKFLNNKLQEVCCHHTKWQLNPRFHIPSRASTTTLPWYQLIWILNLKTHTISLETKWRFMSFLWRNAENKK